MYGVYFHYLPAFGVLRAYGFDITERKLIEEETERVRNELEETTIGILEALSRTVETKDRYTGDHVSRVEEYALELGKRFDLSDERLARLKYAARLHDVGKVRVPDHILGKEGELTDEEWTEMEKHPATGEQIVKQVPRLQRAAEVIGQHQEKYDGTGYPNALAGDDITLEARIIAVVDAWDAMRTDRVYRPALPRERALAELESNAGAQFDPAIVQEFLKILEDEE